MPHALPQPQDVPMDNSSQVQHTEQPPSQITNAIPPMRIDVPSRPNRSSARHGNHSTRTNLRSNTSLGSGAGSKRKTIGLAEFFDISNFGNGKDGFGGGGKRSRFL
jgi:hypothetical protein